MAIHKDADWFVKEVVPWIALVIAMGVAMMAIVFIGTCEYMLKNMAATEATIQMQIQMEAETRQLELSCDQSRP